MDMAILTRCAPAMLGLCCLATATPGVAATMTATYTGIVESSDKTGSAFGLADGISLDGNAVEAAFVYDTRASGIGHDATADYHAIFGGPAFGTVPPVSTASITINGVTLSLPTHETSAVLTYTDHATFSEMYHLVSAGTPNENHPGYDQALVQLVGRAVSDDPAAIPLPLETPLALTDLAPSSRDAFFAYQCSIDFCDDRGDFSSYVVANIRYHTLSVTRAEVAPVPIPSASLLILTGLGVLGGVRRLSRRSPFNSHTHP